jgi:hypothetical protein
MATENGLHNITSSIDKWKYSKQITRKFKTAYLRSGLYLIMQTAVQYTPFTQYVVKTTVLGQWDPYSYENQLYCFEVRIGEWEDDGDDNREAGYFQRRYESLNQYRTSPPFRERNALTPFTNPDTRPHPGSYETSTYLRRYRVPSGYLLVTSSSSSSSAVRLKLTTN